MILVVGAMYSLNYGDGVICETVKNIIESDLELKVSIFGISGKDKFPSLNEKNENKEVIKNNISKKFPVNFILKLRKRRRLREKLDNLNSNEYDAIVFAGGQLFMECFVDYICVIVKWAKKHDIPVIFNCCGVGKVSKLSVLELQKILCYQNVKSITLRDGVNKFKELYKIKKDVETIYDPVVEVSRFYRPEKIRKTQLGIGIIHPKNFRKDCVNITDLEYKQIIKMIIAYCIENKVDFELFTNGDTLDNQYCLEVAEELGCKSKVAQRPNSPEMLIDTICKYEKIISCRLHSHIIATSYEIPTAALIWDTKVGEFMKLIGRKEFCLSLEQLPSSKTIDALMNSLLCSYVANKFDKIPLSSQSFKEFFKLEL